MNISLTTELEELVNDKVKSGRYQTASEVVREGLRLLEEKDLVRQARLEQLRKDVRVGIDQIERGEYIDYDDEGLRQLFETIKREGREKLSKQR